MTTERERFAGVFDGVADGYARERPTYPDALIDIACEGLQGARVLEIGCGTGQLTAALVARGLQVHAIDPAPNMLRNAGHIEGATFENTTFEAFAPGGPFEAVFSASAFHWVDPQVSWAKAAEILTPGGRIALIQYTSAQVPETAEHDDAIDGTLVKVAPEIVATWPAPRDVAELRAGAQRGNVSEVWAWIASRPLAVPETAFTDVSVHVVPTIRERTADDLEALLRTTALWFQLGEERAAALMDETRRVVDGFGGTVRTSEVGTLVMARTSD